MKHFRMLSAGAAYFIFGAAFRSRWSRKPAGRSCGTRSRPESAFGPVEGESADGAGLCPRRGVSWRKHPRRRYADAAHEAEDSLFEWREAAARTRKKAEPTVKASLQEHGIELDRESDPYRLLCMEVSLAFQHLYGVRIERSRGRWGDTSRVFLEQISSLAENPTGLPASTVKPALPSAPLLRNSLKEKGGVGVCGPCG